MVKRVALVLSTVAAFLALPAAAADVTPGFGASLRLGYGIPMGSVTGVSGADLSKIYSGTLPIQLDLGYRITPNLAIAAYGQYAFGFNASGAGSVFNDQCTGGVSCSTRDIRIGAELLVHLSPGAGVDPWIGIGAGYEWAKISVEQAGVSADATFSGWEFVNVQLGLDFEVAPRFAIGPFVQFSVGQYGSYDIATFGSGDVPSKGTHEWLQLGVRGSFGL